MSNKEQDLSMLFEALGNAQRLRILKLLTSSQRPIHLKGVSRELGIDYASTYRHIEKLKDAGILGVHEVGRSRVPYVRKREALEKMFEAASELGMSGTT